MPWTIDKTFSFCYGHRVWSQTLRADLCENHDSSCKCRHLHGHEGLVKVHLTANELNGGMVTDFKHLGWLKDFIDAYLDHKFIIDSNDPLFEELVGAADLLSKVYVESKLVGSQVEVSDMAPGPERELLEGFFVVDFVPTSENLSKWLFEIVEAMMGSIATVNAVEWWETPKSRSIYSR